MVGHLSTSSSSDPGSEFAVVTPISNDELAWIRCRFSCGGKELSGVNQFYVIFIMILAVVGDVNAASGRTCKEQRPKWGDVGDALRRDATVATRISDQIYAPGGGTVAWSKVILPPHLPKCIHSF